MRKFLGLILAVSAFAVESEVQFENELVCAMKVKIGAHEEIGLHRDEYPQIVVALKGGTITRLEADGTKTKVKFPKGEAVYRSMDPVDQLHRSVNDSCKPIELMIIQLKKE